MDIPKNCVVISFEEFDRLRAEAKRVPDATSAVAALQDEIRSLKAKLHADPGTHLAYAEVEDD